MCMSKISFRFQPLLSTLFETVSLCHLLSSWCGSYRDFSCLCLASLLRSHGTVLPMASSFFLMSLLRIQIQVLVHVWPVLYLLSHLPSSHLFAFLYTRSKVLHLITLWAQRWCMMQEMLSKEVAIIVRKHSEMPTFSITFFTLKSHFLSWWVASIGKCACQKPDMLSWSPEQHKHKKNELTPQIFLKSLSLLCACGWHKCTNSNNIYIL